MTLFLRWELGNRQALAAVELACRSEHSDWHQIAAAQDPSKKCTNTIKYLKLSGRRAGFRKCRIHGQSQRLPKGTLLFTGFFQSVSRFSLRFLLINAALLGVKKGPQVAACRTGPDVTTRLAAVYWAEMSGKRR